ncbi:MAG TPA: methionine adenosyltransferase [Methylomirabilota bacterium]|nr:methionine adenosyltransferase [Methylomirabilota bacterium]
MTLTIEALPDAPVARRRMELVERKGLGHPDTVCDSLVEAISVALNRMYLEHLGAIAHYNIDKAMLVAGQCTKDFGSGAVMRPMELIVGDRATDSVAGRRLPVEDTARMAVDGWVAAHLPGVRAGRDLVTRTVLAPGSEELRRIYTDRDPEIASNDTCGASGYAPLSPTEELVLAVERFLNSAGFKAEFPDTGQDVKVLGVRRDDRLALTVAMPLSCLRTSSEQGYFARKEEILHALAKQFGRAPFEIDWRLNCLDRPGRGTAGVYLTLTGTSAEDADSGQVGRGNRVNGLIAFSRPTGGEAAPGKNPVAHAGKVYSVLSHRLARMIYARCPELLEVYVHLAARIGEPVDQPWTGVQLVLPTGLALADVEPAVSEVIAAELGRMADFRGELVRGEHAVC